MYFKGSVVDYGLFDFVVSIILICVALSVARNYYEAKVKGTPGAKMFWPGFWVAIIGGQGMLLLSLSLVPAGDMVNYYKTAHSLIHFLFNDWETLSAILEYRFQDADTSVLDPYRTALNENRVPYIHDDRAFFAGLLSVPFVLLGASSLYNATFVLTFFVFFVRWALFIRLLSLLKIPVIFLAGSILFLPTGLSWTSIIFKETYAFIALIYVVLWFTSENKKRFNTNFIISIILLLASIYIISNTKGYVLYAFLPYLLYYRFGGSILSKLRPGVRVALSLGLFATVLFSFILVINLFSTALGEYSLDALAETTAVKYQDLTQDYYYEGQQTDSRYDIGEYEPTLQGIITKFPIATFTGLFRPLPNDIVSLQIAFSSIESTLLFLSTIFLFIRLGVFRVIRYVLSEPLIFTLLMYAVTMAFFVGLSSGNFGNLVRYRAPMMPFFVASLAGLYGLYLEEKKTKAAARAARMEADLQRAKTAMQSG